MGTDDANLSTERLRSVPSQHFARIHAPAAAYASSLDGIYWVGNQASVSVQKLWKSELGVLVVQLRNIWQSVSGANLFHFVLPNELGVDAPSTLK